MSALATSAISPIRPRTPRATSSVAKRAPVARTRRVASSMTCRTVMTGATCPCPGPVWMCSAIDRHPNHWRLRRRGVFVFLTWLGVDVDLAQVSDGWRGSQLAEDLVTALTRGQLCDAAVRVAQVAEGDRVGRAGLGACRHDFAVFHLAALILRLAAGAADALDAEGAL